MKTALGIRFYEENSQKLGLLQKFISRVSPEVDLIYVVINDTADKTGASKKLQKLNLPKTEILAMNVWGKYTPALNAIIYNTVEQGCTRLFFVSPEMEFPDGSLKELASYMDDSTLAVGAALAGHKFSSGEVVGTGTTVPWNTMALWNLQYLVRTGFVLAGDAPWDPAAAGVEELSTCAVLQTLYPQLKVKLVQIPNIKWHVGELDPERIAAHIKKIDSKNERAEKQLQFLQLSPPKVIHI